MPTLTIVFNQSSNPQWSITTAGGTNVYANPLRLTALGNTSINWQLGSGCNPSDVGFSNTTAKPGVQFQPTSATPARWTQNQPTANANNTQWSVTDNIAAGAKNKFAYTITLVTPNGTTYSTDPDVTNSPQ